MFGVAPPTDGIALASDPSIALLAATQDAAPLLPGAALPPQPTFGVGFPPLMPPGDKRCVALQSNIA